MTEALSSHSASITSPDILPMAQSLCNGMFEGRNRPMSERVFVDSRDMPWKSSFSLSTGCEGIVFQ
jgi:hypothetical protein